MILTLPYRGRIQFTSPFGERTLNGSADWHNGIDLVGLEEKVIRAPCAGTVGVSTMIYKEADRGRTWEWGNYVRIDTADGLRVYLCHMAERYVSAGQRVNAGDPLGVEGETGFAFGSHVHLEVRAGNQAVNPCPMLGIENRAGVLLDGLPLPNWYDDAVAWAQESGILKGTGNGQLSLEEPCTRAQMCVFLRRLYNKIQSEAKK